MKEGQQQIPTKRRVNLFEKSLSGLLKSSIVDTSAAKRNPKVAPKTNGRCLKTMGIQRKKSKKVPLQTKSHRETQIEWRQEFKNTD